MGVQFIEQSIEVMTKPHEYQRFTKELEKIARVCYKSEDKIGPGTDLALLDKIMKNGHGSVLEHMNLTIKLITDRGVSHRFVRHRHTAFMQESTHYIDYYKRGSITVVRQAGWESFDAEDAWEDSMLSAARHYAQVSSAGAAHEIAATVLPQALKTELVMTTNLLQWRHIMKVRSTPKCHPQTRALTRLIIMWFKNELSFFVRDIVIPEVAL